jgi:hypothetical protein
MTRTVLCVLKSGGGEYGPRNVEALQKSLAKHSDARLVCLSDVEVPCERVPLVHDWPKWWPKLELFAHVWPEPVLYADLDTTFIDDPARLWRRDFTMLENIRKPGEVGSGLMSWAGDYRHIYRSFAANPQKFMTEYVTTAKWGDQAFIRDHLGFRPKLYARSDCASYKGHCLDRRGRVVIPPKVCVVYFHGKPRPWEVPEVKR